MCKDCNVHAKILTDSYAYFEAECPKCEKTVTICKPCKVTMRFITEGREPEDPEGDDLIKYKAIETYYQCPKCKQTSGNFILHADSFLDFRA